MAAIAAPAASEHQIQCAYIDIVRAHRPRYPALFLLRAFPNGGMRNAAVAGQLKAEGVEAGPLDIILPVKASGYVGLWFEFKVPGKRPTEGQSLYMAMLDDQGWRTDVQYDAEAAWKMTVAYLNGALHAV